MALPLAAMTAADVVFGSRWNKCLLKAKLAGKVLAELLARGLHGGRPVTLVGSSLGARAVFHCLLELHARGAR